MNLKIGLPAYSCDDLADRDYNPNMTSATRVLITWGKGLKHLEAFWKVWKNDYLLSLRERSKINLKETRAKSPYEGNFGDVTY